MEDLLLQLAYDLLAVLIPVLAAMAVEFMRRRLGIENLKKIQQTLEAKQEIALLAVRFAEQAFKDLHGQEKYDKAAEWLSARVQENGFDISDEEIQGLIEAALRKLKDEFSEEWKEELQQPT